MNSVEKRLLEFNPAQAGKDTVAEFQQIVDSLTNSEKKNLGKKFEIWKNSCLYYFLVSDKKVALSNMAPVIIQKYKESEIEANGDLSGFWHRY